MNEVQMLIFVAVSLLQVNYCVRLGMGEGRGRERDRGGTEGRGRHGGEERQGERKKRRDITIEDAGEPMALNTLLVFAFLTIF